MNIPTQPAELEHRYYLRPAAAFVRGRLGERPGDDATLFQIGIDAGLRLHKFKRSLELPRVRRVLGILHGLAPADLLDIGSGRGTFLWPLWDTFPHLPITAVERSEQRAADLEATVRGGLDRLTIIQGDVTALALPDARADGVTILEVIEHLPEPNAGVREVLRVARRFIVASVPSKPDDNPEHLHLFNAESLTRLFKVAASDLGLGINVRCEYVLNHLVAVVRVDR